MKPVAFELERPGSLDEALALLAGSGRDAKVLAGGQSLMPLLNFRLARPEVLVDLNPVAELRHVSRDGGSLRIGAMTRLRQLERSPELGERWQLVAEALPQVAHTPIRNRGTFGGGLAHADPAAELGAVSLALDATLVARSQARGSRAVPAGDFFRGPYATALEPDEILTEVRLPAQPEGAGWAFAEVARRRGDFALVGVGALLAVGSDGAVREARLAYASMGPRPLRAYGAERALVGQPATEDSFRAAAEAAVRELEPGEDLQAGRAYRLHAGRVLTERALGRALERTGSA
jgi:aerobic carbon-monoxide dehydrogenase medium subunit